MIKLTLISRISLPILKEIADFNAVGQHGYMSTFSSLTLGGGYTGKIQD